MSSQPYTPDGLPLNNLDHRLLLPLVGQAYAALARYDIVWQSSRRGTENCLRNLTQQQGILWSVDRNPGSTKRLVEFLSSTNSFPTRNLPRLARDLHNGLSGEKGFSERNIKRMLAFYREYPNANFVPQAVAQLECDPERPRTSCMESMEQALAGVPGEANS